MKIIGLDLEMLHKKMSIIGVIEIAWLISVRIKLSYKHYFVQEQSIPY